MKRKLVLIIEDDRTYSTLLATHCQQLGLRARVAADAMSAVGILSDECPDLILLDIELPGRTGETMGAYGPVLAATLRTTSAWDLPIIVLTGRNDAEMVWKCHEASLRHVHKGPQSWKTLKAAILELLHVSATKETDEIPVGTDANRTELGHSSSIQPQIAQSVVKTPSPRILCVDDDRDFTLALCIRLKELGAIPMRGFTGTQGYVVALAEKPGVIISDLQMPDGEGNYLIERLKSNPSTKDIPIIILTGQRNPGVLRNVRNIGADACLAKPVVMNLLVKEINRFVAMPLCKASVV